MEYILLASQIMTGIAAVLAVICSVGVWRSPSIRGMSVRKETPTKTSTPCDPNFPH